MIDALLTRLKDGIEIRQTLSKIRQAIKDEETFSDLYNIMWDQTNLLIPLLQSEDAKTRKNTALLMGDLAMDDFLEPLFTAYQKEETLFVRGSYLTAMKNFDYEELLPKLHKQYDKLCTQKTAEENKKHIEEEIRLLRELIIEEEGIPMHTFTGMNRKHQCVLLTNRNHADFVATQLTELGLKPTVFSAGVHVVTDALEPLLSLRTYQEILFEPDMLKPCSFDAKAIVSMLLQSDLLAFLQQDHKGDTPFYYRIELKSNKDLRFKSDLTKKIASTLELESNRMLLNSPSHYEIELRIIENEEGNCSIMVKYFTLPDHRFSYRTESVAASIKPTDAALLAALAQPYMAEDAQVLDPFCGVGTMLIERQKIQKANTSYGIDIYPTAIAKAQENTQNARHIIHYINKDFFNFTHEYLFDEIFTNMPFAAGKTTQQEIVQLYEQFFKKIPSLLTKEGKVILYTHNATEAKKIAAKNSYKLLAAFPYRNKPRTDLLIFSR